MKLSDGRQLGFAEWGDPQGDMVVFDFHGGPGCRLVISADPNEIERGVRWISMDRPGLGLSWPHPNRALIDFTADVEQLADHLHVGRFFTVGWSMGGPYAAACAAALPDRVLGFALLAPAPARLDREVADVMGKAWAWQMAHDDPWQLAQIYTALALEARRNRALAVELFSAGLSASEHTFMERNDIQAWFCEFIIEATRQGTLGLVDDMRVEMQPWGFDPTTVTRPGFLWQGDDDSFITAAENATWKHAVPALDMQVLSGEGHLFPLTHTRELIAALRALDT